jgi:hypothetical protein
MFVDTRMRRRIRVEIVRWRANPREMLAGVSAQYRRFVGGLGLPPCPIVMPAPQERDGAADPLWPLGMPGRRIFDATLIVKNNHAGNSFVRRRSMGGRLTGDGPLGSGKSGDWNGLSRAAWCNSSPREMFCNFSENFR